MVFFKCQLKCDMEDKGNTAAKQDGAGKNTGDKLIETFSTVMPEDLPKEQKDQAPTRQNDNVDAAPATPISEDLAREDDAVLNQQQPDENLGGTTIVEE